MLRQTFLIPAFLAAAAAALAACSSDAPPTAEFHFDRPSDVAFGCITFDRLDDGGVDNSRTVAAPLADCSLTSDQARDAGMVSGALVGFTTQTTKSDVVVANLGNGDVGDSDPLTPGHTGLSVGSRPVSADTTPNGCFIVVANSGSCDLSHLDVFKASAALRPADLFVSGASSRHLVRATAGPLAAAPSWIVTPPPEDGRVTCPTAAEGLAYVAYPSCHLVAAVDLATGNIVSSLSFPAGGGVPTIGGADVTCPAECPEIVGAAIGAASTGAEPTALAMDPDGSRLYVAARDQSAIYVVDLTAGVFTLATEVPLEDAGGVLRLVASRDLSMGQMGISGTRRFVYAVAADASVRVVEVTPATPARECDTQVDPRYLRDATDVSLLPCFAVGALTTPARRASARGPGIRLPGDAVPYDVAFIQGTRDFNADPAITQPSPFRLNGSFAVVTGKDQSLSGVAFYVNIDDENYEDLYDPTQPTVVDMTLALPHQLRDGIADRRHPPPATCVDDNVLETRTQGPVRALSDFTLAGGLTYNFGVLVDETLRDADGNQLMTYVEGALVPGRVAPLIHLERCLRTNSSGEPDGERTVFQTSATAPAAVRAKVFPDLAATPIETWIVSWEGPLAASALEQIHQGGVVRPVPGQLELELSDASQPFCDVGAEERDIVRLDGCINDTDCAFDELCIFDAETPAGLGGMCLPASRAEELAATCKQYLISQRKYLVKASPADDNGADAVKAGSLVLVPKPTVLSSTPYDGCTSNLQCQELYDDEKSVLEAETGLPQARDETWTCQPSAELGDHKRCIAICPNNNDDECPTGSVCQDLRCIEGAFPPAECVAPLQIYEVRAGNAFTVVGTTTGYLHNRILDPGTGTCVDDAAGDPLRVGRFHPREEACVLDDGNVPTGPNPCSLDLLEPVGVRRAGQTAVEIGTRRSLGIRFRNLSFRIDISDVVSLHPKVAGVFLVAVPLAFRFLFEIGGGFAARADQLSSPPALLPTRVRLGPDGAVWVVDSGDANTLVGVRRGQILRLTAEGLALIIN